MKPSDEVERELAYWQGVLNAFNWASDHKDDTKGLETKRLEAKSKVEALSWALAEEQSK